MPRQVSARSSRSLSKNRAITKKISQTSKTTKVVTKDDKTLALEALKARRKEAKKKGQIDNSSLCAGSSMYYYCQGCGLQSDVLPESWDPRFTQPKKLCSACQEMKDKDWLE